MKSLTLSRWLRVIATLLVVAALSIIVATATGSSKLPLKTVARVILSGDRGSNEAVIIWSVRLPRVLLAGIVGGSLAAAGVVFQALLRNPLADPYILGVSGGGAVGAILAMIIGIDVTFWGFSTVPVFAFLGSLGTVFLVYTVAQVKGRLVVQTLLLTGVIANAIFSAVIMFMISVVDINKVQGIMFWLMGNLGVVDYGSLWKISLYVLVGLVVLFSRAVDLNLMSLGEEQASQLGTNVERTKFVAFLGASLATGAVVSVSGLIGFVGLIVPHAVRLALGPDHRLLLPAATLCGAIFLIAADTLARTLLAPVELPVGVITAICGGPFFIWLLKSRQRRTL